MQTKPLQIGVTGGIGSGKSTVSRIFSIIGVPHYDADKRAKRLMENSEDVISKISSLFGEKAYTGRNINRDFIAGIVFNDKQMLDNLNSVVHPAVGLDYSTWVDHHTQFTYVIKEAALLIESGSHQFLDLVINVWSPMELRIERVLKRDPFRSEREIRQIIDKQLSDSQREEKTDHKIVNDERQSIIKQVLELHRKFS